MALIATLAVFFHLALCGRGWLALCRVNLGHTRTWLLAPSVGLALNTIAFLIFSQAGLPVATFARPLALGLLLLSLAVCWWGQRPRLRGLGVFLLLALAALAVGAWPMLVHGFNWISVGNDDMTNYCLSAQRLMRHGFYRLPELQELAGSDYSQFYWIAYVPLLLRVGSELTLAGTAGVLGCQPVDVFMPVIFCLGLTQQWALGALLYSAPRHRNRAVLACALLAVAPLWVYGILHQLIAQVAGVSLLLALLVLVARRHFARSPLGRLRQAAVIGLPAAALSVYYPEVIPFLILALALFTVVYWVRSREMIPGQLPTALYSLVVLVVLLRHNIFSTFVTLLGQAAGGLSAEDITQTIFPYFLVPKGLSFLVGFETITRLYPEPWGSLCIVAAAILLVLAGLSCVKGVWRARVSSCLLLVMFALGAKLFQGNNSFGLFKLTMFMTPVLTAEIAILLSRWCRRGAWAGAAGLAVIWFSVTQENVRTSRPDPNNIFTEVDDASNSKGTLPAGDAAMYAAITSSPIAKLAAGEQRNTPLIFLSRPFLKGILEIQSYVPPDWVWPFMPDPAVPAKTKELTKAVYKNIFVPRTIFGTTFWPAPAPFPRLSDRLLTSRSEHLAYNKLSPIAMPASGLFGQAAIADLRNHVVFVHSAAGQHYYLGETGLIGAYKPQPDIYAPGATFFAIGQKLMFQVFNPSPVVRMRVSLTDSIIGDGRTQLPEKAVARGEGAPVLLGFTGSGSANVYSAPLHPRTLDQRAYVGLDLLRQPAHLPQRHLGGLNRLYNQSVNLDPRIMNGYCRDISLISEEEYLAMARPTRVANFPKDLLDPSLEYSGWYEDGWVSGRSFVVLGGGQPGRHLVLKGMVPTLPDASLADNRLQVVLNGVPAGTAQLTPGNFELSYPVPDNASTLRVDLQFSREGALPGGDGRPVAALLTLIGIQPEN